MSHRVDLVRSERLRKGHSISSLSPVPLLSLDEAARLSPTSTKFGIVGKVVKVCVTCILPLSSLHSDEIPACYLKRKRILLRDIVSRAPEDDIQTLFYLSCFGCYAQNLELTEVEEGDDVIILLPYIYLKRWRPEENPADLRFSCFEVMIGHIPSPRLSNSTTQTSQIIVLRKKDIQLDDDRREKDPKGRFSASRLQPASPSQRNHSVGYPETSTPIRENNVRQLFDNPVNNSVDNPEQETLEQAEHVQDNLDAVENIRTLENSTRAEENLPATTGGPSPRPSPRIEKAPRSFSQPRQTQDSTRLILNNDQPVPSTSRAAGAGGKRTLDSTSSHPAPPKRRIVGPDRNYNELSRCVNIYSRYNVWAVVTKITRPASQTRGTRFMAILYIQDQNYEGSFGYTDFQFNILGPHLADFPPLCVGDVVRIHNMKLEMFNSDLTGKVFEPQCVMVVPGRVGEPMKPLCSAKNFTFTDYDRKKVNELRLWWDEICPRDFDRIDSQCEKCISEIDRPMTFDLLCKVLDILDSDQVSHISKKVLRVSDGTKSQLTLISIAGGENISRSESSSTTQTIFDSKMKRLKVDIFVKADVSFIDKISIGDVILLTGVRCIEEKYLDQTNSLETTVYRLTLPNENTIDVKVMPSKHSSAKQIERQIKRAEFGQDQISEHDSELENLLAGINADSVNTESTNASLHPQNSTQENTSTNQQRSTDHNFKSPAAAKQFNSQAVQQPSISGAEQTDLFPDSQEFNQLIINATNISGHPVLQPHTGNDVTGKEQNPGNEVASFENLSQRAKDNSAKPPRTFGNRQSDSSSMPMVTIYAANHEEFLFEPDSPSQASQHQRPQPRETQPQGTTPQDLQSREFQSRVESGTMTSSQESSSSEQLITTGFRQLDSTLNQRLFSQATSNSSPANGSTNTQDYFTCQEDEDEPGLDSRMLESRQDLQLESFRCSPSPERQLYSINTQTDFPWATISELLECASNEKRRIVGFVKRISPDLRRSGDPLEMLSILCTNEDCSTAAVLPRLTRSKSASSFRCSKCSMPAKIIFNVALLISETEASNFAITAPAKLVFSSGVQAETLFCCNAIEFYTSELIRSDTVAKWVDLIDKPVQLSVTVIALENGVKELHLVYSVVS